MTEGAAKPAARAAIADFLDMLAAERGAARNTLDAYARDLGDYALGLARRGREPLTATIQDIRDYLSSLAEAGLKPSSSARKLSAIRQFHRFLAAEERRADDPAVLLEGPRQGRRLPKILSIAEVDAILRVCREGLDDPARPAEERLRARRAACLVEVLYASGLRVSELVALPLAAAKQAEKAPEQGGGFLTIKGKGGRERLAPFDSRRARGHGGLSQRLAGASSRGGGAEMAVSFGRRERPSDPAGFRARIEISGGGGGR